MHRVIGAEFRQERMSALGTGVQRASPAGLQLIVHPGLSARKVFDPGETVVVTLVADACLIHLPGQPLATVHVDLAGKRKPGLEPGAHEAEC